MPPLANLSDATCSILTIMFHDLVMEIPTQSLSTNSDVVAIDDIAYDYAQLDAPTCRHLVPQYVTYKCRCCLCTCVKDQLLI